MLIGRRKGGNALLHRKEPPRRVPPPQRNIQPRIQMDHYIANNNLNSALDQRANQKGMYENHSLVPAHIPGTITQLIWGNPSSAIRGTVIDDYIDIAQKADAYSNHDVVSQNSVIQP